MIREIEVSNFQSLRRLKVRLGKFTVITGRTGAGKSGFIRAMKTLAFNASGTSFITHGEKACSVSMAGDDIEMTGIDDDPWQVTITRGSRNSYKVDYSQMGERESETFTKLDRKVPELVTKVMRFAPINFAGQYDRPYLLDSTGSEVARVLGRLTNVTLLYRAAQEANRRRLAVSGELKTRAADLEELQVQAKQYATLGAEREAVVLAEAALERMQKLSAARSALGMLTVDYETAWRRKHSLRDVPEPPSLDRLDRLLAQRQKLRELTGQVDHLAVAARLATDDSIKAVASARAAQSELNDYTAQWGVCPTCGQPVRTHLHRH